MNALECSQHVSHYLKYMGIFRDAQGQLHVTPLSEVQSGRTSYSCERLWFS